MLVRLYETTRQQDNEKECWGLGKEEGLRVKVEGLKFFCKKEEKRRLEGCWILWWEGFLIVFIVAIETIEKG